MYSNNLHNFKFEFFLKQVSLITKNKASPSYLVITYRFRFRFDYINCINIYIINIIRYGCGIIEINNHRSILIL